MPPYEGGGRYDVIDVVSPLAESLKFMTSDSFFSNVIFVLFNGRNSHLVLFLLSGICNYSSRDFRVVASQ